MLLVANLANTNYLCSCAFDESSLSIGRVKISLNTGSWVDYSVPIVYFTLCALVISDAFQKARERMVNARENLTKEFIQTYRDTDHEGETDA